MTADVAEAFGRAMETAAQMNELLAKVAGMNHSELDTYVRDQANARGLFAYHTRDSRGSQRGMPDWFLLGAHGILWRECKIPPDKCTSEQRALGYALQALRQDWAVWTPADKESGLIAREMEAIA